MKKSIAGYEGIYEIHENGDIQNTQGSILKPSLTSKGYLKIRLSKDGVASSFRVHRLVAIAFIPNPEELPFVDHRDEDKLNPHKDNLRWCTHQQNVDWHYDNNPHRKGERKERVYGNTEDMIRATGKAIMINDIKYDNCGDAARFICKGTERKVSTVSKELRKMLSGKRSFGTMYGGFDIGKAGN